jgi:hypothetical protein
MRSQPNVPTKNAWAFFGLTILEAILICVLEGVIFYFIDSVISFKSSDSSARTVLTYLIIYIFASYSSPCGFAFQADLRSVFQVVLTFMAIRQRNTIQIIGLVIFNATFIVYSAMQVLKPRLRYRLLCDWPNLGG